VDYVKNLIISGALRGARMIFEADRDTRRSMLPGIARMLLLAGHTPLYIPLGMISRGMNLSEYLQMWWNNGLYRVVARDEEWGSAFMSSPTIVVLDDYEYFVEYPSIYGRIVHEVWDMALVIGVEPGYVGDDIDEVGTKLPMGGRMRRIEPLFVASLIGSSKEVDMVVV